MRVAIVTMVYNERFNLPIWLRHYAAHCPGATLFAIDHGSDDGSTRNLSGVNVIPLPRTPFDDQTRAEFVADFQRALLRFFDVFIYTDCDEMLVADPGRHASLASFLAAVNSDVIGPIGLNVHHLPGIEAPIDLASPILGQRRYVRFAAGACKPLISRIPLTWGPGFHWCDRIKDCRADLFQFHLRRMDVTLSMERLRLTRGMAWSERGLLNFGPRQRQSDEMRIREEFEEPTNTVKAHGAALFAFEKEMKRHSNSLCLSDGFYRGEFFRGPIMQLPEAFFGMI
jgi:hypothetical protein